MNRTVALLSLLLWSMPVAARARADGAPVAEASARVERASDAPVVEAEPSLDFDLLESAVPAAAPRLVDRELEVAVARRRTMLTLHQGLGLATLASLAGAVAVGQAHLNDRYLGGGDTGRFRLAHTGLVVSSTTLFASVGLLGLLAPTPFKKEPRWDTITFHRIFMSLATVGMLSQVVLGKMTVAHEGRLSQVGLIRAHQVVGYATLGALSAGAVTLVF
jgi:hypothetical protein